MEGGIRSCGNIKDWWYKREVIFAIFLTNDLQLIVKPQPSIISKFSCYVSKNSINASHFFSNCTFVFLLSLFLFIKEINKKNPKLTICWHDHILS